VRKNPKSETGNPKEGRKPAIRNGWLLLDLPFRILDFGLGISFGFLVSDFGF